MEAEAKPVKDKTPNYWELLCEEDKSGYRALKMALDATSGKRNRGHRIEAFDKILETIHRFAERHDENDWQRFLVCGVCWMDNMIAINTRQLRLLISKCKSSINGSFQKLGYSTNQSHTESWRFLFDRIPLLKDNFNELRQWTIRCRVPGPQTIVAYADGQSCILPQDPTQPIQMQIAIPQFNQATSRNEAHHVQLNLLIPPVVIDGRVQQNTITNASITSQQQQQQLQLQQQQQQQQNSIKLSQQPKQQEQDVVKVLPVNQQFQAMNPQQSQTGEVVPQPIKEVENFTKDSILKTENDPTPEPYCPLKFRSRLMHRQSSCEIK